MKEISITEKEREILLKSQKGEMDGVAMYQALAKAVHSKEDAAVFTRLAAEEGQHAAVFRAYTGQACESSRIKGSLLACLYRILGRKRLYPLIAKGEYSAVKNYESLTKRFPEVESVKNDEQRHGDTVMALLQ